MKFKLLVANELRASGRVYTSNACQQIADQAKGKLVYKNSSSYDNLENRTLSDAVGVIKETHFDGETVEIDIEFLKDKEIELKELGFAVFGSASHDDIVTNIDKFCGVWPKEKS